MNSAKFRYNTGEIFSRIDMSPSLQDAISQTLIEQKACARAFNRYYYLSIAVILAIVPIGLYLDGVKVDTPLIKIAEFLGALIFFSDLLDISSSLCRSRKRSGNSLLQIL